MKSPPIRLTAVFTHPVQYLSPWLRHLTESCPDIDLTVLYAIEPTEAQQGLGFGRAFAWNVPLREGYRSRVLRASRPSDDPGSDRLFGADASGVGAAIDETSPDVVLLGGWHSSTQWRALLHCRRRSIPIVYRGDSNLESRPQGLRGFGWGARTRRLLGQFDAWLAVGSRARRYLDALGRPPERVFDSPHAVDNARFAEEAARWRPPEARRRLRAELGLDADAFTVLFVGKLIPKKRVNVLLDAMARLGPGVRLAIAGSGPEEASLRRQADALGLQPHWLGFINQAELPRAYVAADCLALPSDSSETWGLVVNEALACGTPVVASDAVGSAPDLVIPGVTGELFPLDDAPALAEAIARVRRRRADGDDVATACRAHVARFDFAAASAGLVAACASVRRRPRVLALCGHMTVFTGLERMVFEGLRVVSSRGAAVHCIVSKWSNERIVAESERIGATWSAGTYDEHLNRHTRNPITIAKMAWGITRCSTELFVEVARFRPTHILVPDFIAVLRHAPALWVLRRVGIPVTLRLGNAPATSSVYPFLWRHVATRLVDRFICNSKFTHHELLSLGIDPRNTCVVYNTAPARPHPADDLPTDEGRILYVGQILPGKGVHLLLEAVAQLRANGLPATVDVVGRMDGWVAPGYEGYREQLLERAARPDLAGVVRFLGWREDVPALMRSAAVHCAPSTPDLREAFGCVVVEAKEAGVPSVVTPSGGLPELIDDGHDGRICPSTTPEAIAHCLSGFLRDREFRVRAGSAARASYKRFSRERFAEEWWREFIHARQ